MIRAAAVMDWFIRHSSAIAVTILLICFSGVAVGAPASASVETDTAKGGAGTRAEPTQPEANAKTQKQTRAKQALALQAPDTTVAGSLVKVTWRGATQVGAAITVARQNAEGGDYIGRVAAESRQSVSLRLPAEPGDYEIRYVAGQPDRIVARTTITVAPLHASLDAVRSAPVGTQIDVFWTGPGLAGDTIRIGERFQRGFYDVVSQAKAAKGNPVQLTVPAQPGIYEINYSSKIGHRTLARRQIKATPVRITLHVPDTVPAYSEIDVRWTDEPEVTLERYIEVAPVGVERGSVHSSSGYGDMIPLQMPAKPGRYEVRFVVSGRIMASQVVEVIPGQATLQPPNAAVAGAVIRVRWNGPNHDWDSIAIARLQAPAGEAADSQYTNTGSPVELRMPAAPGQYEIRYRFSDMVDSPQRIVARAPIRITPAQATLHVPAKAPAGSLVAIEFSGPTNRGDRIVVAAPGADDKAFINFARTPETGAAKLRLPGHPGTYEIRYVTGHHHQVLAREQVKAMPVSAHLSGPASAVAGSTVDLRWQGPAYPYDYIAVAAAGGPAGAFISRRYIDNGLPHDIRVPTTPGRYEIRYILAQSDTIIASHVIRVTARESATGRIETGTEQARSAHYVDLENSMN